MRSTDERIREELSGNLCRCTGYVGIVNAVRAVAIGKLPGTAASTAVVRIATPVAIATAATPAQPTTAAASATLTQNGQSTLTEHIVVNAAPDVVWAALADPRRVTACVPGAEITEIDGEQLVGTVRVAMGPIKAAFVGRGTLTRNDATREGSIIGQSRDAGSGSLAHGEARFAVRPAPTGDSTILDVTLSWRLSGMLAQFNRSGPGPRHRTANRHQLRAQPGGVAYERGTTSRASTRSVGAAMVDDQTATARSLTEVENDIFDRGTMCADRTVCGGCCIILTGGGGAMRLCAGRRRRRHDTEHHRSSAGSARVGPDGVGCRCGGGLQCAASNSTASRLPAVHAGGWRGTHRLFLRQSRTGRARQCPRQRRGLGR